MSSVIRNTFYPRRSFVAKPHIEPDSVGIIPYDNNGALHSRRCTRCTGLTLLCQHLCRADCDWRPRNHDCSVQSKRHDIGFGALARPNVVETSSKQKFGSIVQKIVQIQTRACMHICYIPFVFRKTVHLFQSCTSVKKYFYTLKKTCNRWPRISPAHRHYRTSV